MIKFDEHIFQMGWNHHLVVFLAIVFVVSMMETNGAITQQIHILQLQCLTIFKWMDNGGFKTFPV